MSKVLSFFFFLRYCSLILLTYLFWLCWVFVAAWPFLWLWCSGFSLWWFLLLRSTGSGMRGLSSCGSWPLEHRLRSWVVHELSHSTACGIFPDQGWNPRLLHWQADSLPLSHQGSPEVLLLCLYVVVTYCNLCDSDALVFETCFAADNMVSSCKYSKCA